MTNPPATCPACGSQPIRKTEDQINFECGSTFVFRDVSDYLRRNSTPRLEWVAGGVGGCQRVYEAAVKRGIEIEKLREENERLRAEINGFLIGDVQPEETKD